MTTTTTSAVKTLYTGLYQVNGGTQRLHYIAGPEGLAALIVTYSNNSTRTVYYLQTDYQGSLVAVYNSNGTLNKQFSYDPWGRRRNAANWSDYTVSAETLFTRGYTGHEHLDDFGLINMNGRVYDPRLARFLSPDNYVQAPTNTQSYNRYSYCLNNPMKYTDPSGNTWFSHLKGWLGEHPAAMAFVALPAIDPVSYTSFDATLGGSFTTGFIRNGFKGGFNNGINTIKIDLGLFAADTDRGGWGWQILSRFTWQLPQTALGLTAAQGENTFGQVESVGYCEGATVVTKKVESAFFGQTTAYTLGSYIIGGNDLQANVRNPLFQHEYGHYLQSQASGWSYIPRFAIPSALNPSRNGGYTDLSENAEQDAQARSLLYFTNYVDGFTYNDWDYNENPFYDKPNGSIVNQSLINEGFLKGKLMIATYMQELIINYVRNSTRNY